jgi:hypothetical protein
MSKTFFPNVGNSGSGSWLFSLLPEISGASAFDKKFMFLHPFIPMLKANRSKNGNRVLTMLKL